jgi:hypothetical protein
MAAGTPSIILPYDCAKLARLLTLGKEVVVIQVQIYLKLMRKHLTKKGT